MKIAFLNIYNGLVERGSEVFVQELASRLSKKYAVCVFQTGGKNDETYEIREVKGIPFAPHQSSQGIKNRFYDVWVLLFTLKCWPFLWREKYDWIIPVNGRFQVIICRILRFLRGGKILITGHAGIGCDDRLNLKIGKPDVFVTLTPASYAWAKREAKKTKLIMIPNGVDVKRFNPGIKPAELNLKRPVVLCVSALLAYKRIDLLIRAVEKLKTASLLLIGDGPLGDELKNLGSKLLGDRFCCISRVNHENIASYYKAADIFSLPSRKSEAFGLVYLEALSCGVPAVAPDDDSRRMIIGEAGLLCRVEDSDNYAASLKKAMEINWEEKPILQAKKFSWEKIALRYLDLLEGNI
jgi:glycosyltransferase involved in cell wall biosynthesis